MIGVYTRVSDKGQKLDSQKQDIQQWLERHGYRADQCRWFEDKQSGRNLNRVGFKALQKAIFDGELDTIVVWKLDRVARNYREGVNVLADWCSKDIRVVSVTQQIDLSGTVGQLIGGVLFAIAEIDLQNIRERQAAGIAVAKERGVYTGRKKGTVKANPERAKELAQKGLSRVEIANALNVSERTVYRYLRTP